MREYTKDERAERARHGWFNWYVNRGHMALAHARDADLRKAARQVSWRRKF